MSHVRKSCLPFGCFRPTELCCQWVRQILFSFSDSLITGPLRGLSLAGVFQMCWEHGPSSRWLRSVLQEGLLLCFQDSWGANHPGGGMCRCLQLCRTDWCQWRLGPSDSTVNLYWWTLPSRHRGAFPCARAGSAGQHAVPHNCLSWPLLSLDTVAD